MNPFPARFDSKCGACKKWLRKGDAAVMESGRAVHFPVCPGRYGLTAGAARNEGARDSARAFIGKLEAEIGGVA